MLLMVFKSFVYFLFLVECQTLSTKNDFQPPGILQKECIGVNINKPLYCNCNHFYTTFGSTFNIEDLHYYKIKLKCKSRKPFKEVLSYYRIKSTFLKHFMSITDSNAIWKLFAAMKLIKRDI